MTSGAADQAEGIWSGRIIYSAMNARALIADVSCTLGAQSAADTNETVLIKQNYKTRPIQMYNPHKAPLLDHYRYVRFHLLLCAS